MNPLARQILADHAGQAGSHDQPEIFGEPIGDPGLTGPGSVSWKVNGDVAAVTLASVAAITLELLHPSVMAGVGQQSSYREQPFRRAQTTFGWVITTTFGSTVAAERLIERVKRMHSRVNGFREDGVPYRALDPELIAWVHTCIPWMVMSAYERFNAPLTPAERDRYLDEQSIVGLKSGADAVPTSVRELDAFVAEMRPKLAMTDGLREFFDFLIEGPLGPIPPLGPAERPAKAFQVAAGMSLTPRWAQEMTGFARSRLEQRLLQAPVMHSYGRLLRWAYGTPPWVALAEQRAGLRSAEREPAPRASAALDPVQP